MKNYTLLLIFSALCIGLNAQFYIEEFDNGIPDEWTAENAWTSGTSGTLSSSAFAIPDRGRFVGINDDQLGATFNSEGMLISPSIDLSSLDESYAVSFFAYFLNSDYQGSNETAKLLASTNNGQSWIELADIEPAFEWQRINVGLGDLAGEDQVLFAFEYDDDRAWNYGVAIDAFQIGQIFQRDIAVADYSVPKYIPNAGDQFMQLSVVNLGIEDVNTFTIEIEYEGQTYSVDTGSPPLKYGQDYDLEVQIPFDFNETELYAFDFKISNINGGLDLNDDNSQGSLNFSTVADPPAKVTVAEEGTGTWCGWCPRGAVWLEIMKADYHDNFIGIAVHNNDPMTMPEYDGPLGVTGFPGLYIDRKILIDPGDVEAYHLENISQISPIGVDFEFEYDPTERKLNVFPSASVHTRLDGDYRFSIILTEDEVRGSAGGFAQSNYYSNSIDLIDIHGNNWRDFPDPVPADQMVYHEVARAIIGDFEGFPGSIGAELNNGDLIEANYEYVIPDQFDENEINIVVIAIDAESGEVLNGKQKRLLGEPSSISELDGILERFQFGPNPTKDYIDFQLQMKDKIDLRIELLSIDGRVIQDYNLGRNSVFNERIGLPDLSSGSYILSFRFDETILNKQLMITN